jgi:hypothetical protein
LDYEDSFSSGDGNVMIFVLISLLEKEKDNLCNLSVIDLKTKLELAMKESFIGDLQHPCVSVSDDLIWNKKLFGI